MFEFIGEKPYSDQEQWSTEITKLFDKRGVCISMCERDFICIYASKLILTYVRTYACMHVYIIFFISASLWLYIHACLRLPVCLLISVYVIRSTY